MLVVSASAVKGSVCGVDAKSREAALGILICISRLPYPELFQYRPVVLKSLMPALDDPRRFVRQAAVKCRNMWFLLG